MKEEKKTKKFMKIKQLIDEQIKEFDDCVDYPTQAHVDKNRLYHSYMHLSKKLIEAVGSEITNSVTDLELHQKRRVWEAEQDGFDEAIRRVSEAQGSKLKEILSSLK